LGKLRSVGRIAFTRFQISHQLHRAQVNGLIASCIGGISRSKRLLNCLRAVGLENSADSRQGISKIVDLRAVNRCHPENGGKSAPGQSLPNCTAHGIHEPRDSHSKIIFIQGKQEICKLFDSSSPHFSGSNNRITSQHIIIYSQPQSQNRFSPNPYTQTKPELPQLPTMQFPNIRSILSQPRHHT
jgi:hypothetical protein